MKKAKLWTRDYVMVMISNFSAGFSYSTFATVLALHVNAMGGSNSMAGLMAGGLTLTMMLTRPIFGNLLDRIGRKPMVVWGGILFALNTIAYNFAFSLAILGAIRVIHGISQGMYVVSTSTLVADIVPEERMVEGIGIFGVSSSIASALGPMIGLVIYETFGAQVLFLFMSVFASLGAVAAMMIHIPPVEKLPHGEQLSFSARVRRLPAFIAGLIELTALLPGAITLCVWLGYSSVQNFLTTCGQARGIGSVSLYFTICSGMMIVTRFGAGKVTRVVGNARLIILGVIAMALSMVCVAFAHSLTALIVAAVLYGLGNGFVQPILQALVFQLCAPNRRGAANATFGLMQDVGSGSGSAIWGGVTTGLGYTATYLAAAGCVAVGGLIHVTALWPKLRRSKKAVL